MEKELTVKFMIMMMMMMMMVLMAIWMTEKVLYKVSKTV